MGDLMTCVTTSRSGVAHGDADHHRSAASPPPPPKGGRGWCDAAQLSLTMGRSSLHGVQVPAYHSEISRVF